MQVATGKQQAEEEAEAGPAPPGAAYPLPSEAQQVDAAGVVGLLTGEHTGGAPAVLQQELPPAQKHRAFLRRAQAGNGHALRLATLQRGREMSVSPGLTASGKHGARAAAADLLGLVLGLADGGRAVAARHGIQGAAHVDVVLPVSRRVEGLPVLGAKTLSPGQAGQYMRDNEQLETHTYKIQVRGDCYTPPGAGANSGGGWGWISNCPRHLTD